METILAKRLGRTNLELYCQRSNRRQMSLTTNWNVAENETRLKRHPDPDELALVWFPMQSHNSSCNPWHKISLSFASETF